MIKTADIAVLSVRRGKQYLSVLFVKTLSQALVDYVNCACAGVEAPQPCCHSVIITVHLVKWILCYAN